MTTNEIGLKAKNDEEITFRLPTALKLMIPGASWGVSKRTGKEKVIFESSIRVGRIYRDLTRQLINGKSTPRGEKEITAERNMILEQERDLGILRLGIKELLKLMALVRPSKAQMSKIDVKKIQATQEVM